MTGLKLFLTVPFFIAYLTSFAQVQSNNADANDSSTIQFKQKDTSYWVDNFRQFRDAIYQKDKAKAKSFVDFPIMNENNEIWYLAYDQNEKLIEKLPEKIKPFTEQDFDKYFDKIFSKRFINCILKIKTDELYKKGAYTTIDFNDSITSTIYNINATFDKSENTIQLNLYSQTQYKSKNGEDDDGGEFSIVYFLTITKNGHIKFKQVRLAG